MKRTSRRYLVLSLVIGLPASSCGGDAEPQSEVGWQGEVWIYNNLQKADTDCTSAQEDELLTLFWNDGSPVGCNSVRAVSVDRASVSFSRPTN